MILALLRATVGSRGPGGDLVRSGLLVRGSGVLTGPAPVLVLWKRAFGCRLRPFNPIPCALSAVAGAGRFGSASFAVVTASVAEILPEFLNSPVLRLPLGLFDVWSVRQGRFDRGSFRLHDVRGVACFVEEGQPHLADVGHGVDGIFPRTCFRRRQLPVACRARREYNAEQLRNGEANVRFEVGHLAKEAVEQ